MPSPIANEVESNVTSNGHSRKRLSTTITSSLPDGENGSKKDEKPRAKAGSSNPESSPVKRRKVNHACIYCRRSERPCARCVKRDIGHLCHDESREASGRKPRSDLERAEAKFESSSTALDTSTNLAPYPTGSEGGPTFVAGGTEAFRPTSKGGAAQSPENLDPNSSVVKPAEPVCNEQWPGPQNQFQDMHTFHPSYMFNANELTNEYNALNDFLSTSLLDDGIYSNLDPGPGYNASSLAGSMAPPPVSHNTSSLPLLHRQQTPTLSAKTAVGALGRNASITNLDKAKAAYYMTAADPAGSDPPGARMDKLLKAKFDAGLLKPFNYIKGYARLQQYMDSHMQAASKQKILRQLDKFRPKFRERMHRLTDVELVRVEMWFERSLMEYDRIFASMAIPACCWRRTGEIFRGNREMAELIQVDIDSLRDGKLSLHEIIVEDQLVSYWENFGAIAFDGGQKAMLTKCALKSPSPGSVRGEIKCCFSFTVRRDSYDIPSLIVGNFLPVEPAEKV